MYIDPRQVSLKFRLSTIADSEKKYSPYLLLLETVCCEIVAWSPCDSIPKYSFVGAKVNDRVVEIGIGALVNLSKSIRRRGL